MARNAGSSHSRSRAWHCNWSNARDRAHFGRDGAVVVHGFWKSFLPDVVERADRLADGANLQLCDFAVRRVARAGVGGDAGTDDPGTGNQHHRQVLN